MKNLFLVLTLLLTGCGSSLSVDGSPAWDLAGRYGIEMVNDCNTTKLSIGLGGCAFKESELGGNLRLPSLWTGSLSFVAYGCKNFTQAATSTADNVIQIRDMYTATDHKNCVFDIERSVREGTIISDRSLLGRFGIKIISNNAYAMKLKFAANNEMFDGIGWYQRRTTQPNTLRSNITSMTDAILTIYPTGQKGLFTAKCGTDTVLNQQYTSSPFTVNLDSMVNCDYEIGVTNGDNRNIEEAMYMHMVSKYTDDVSVPAVSIKSKKITFTFNDKDATGKKPVVVGVQIDTTKCFKTNKCTVLNTKPSYLVKGVTPGIRLFWGTYTVATNKWELK